MASALDLVHQAPSLKPLRIAETLQPMVFTLASSLERRNMKLSTLGVDLSVLAQTDATTLSHVLWMMQLGIIRYAESESTLHLGCRLDAGRRQAVVSITVSELAPGKLTADERHHYLLQKINQDEPHMFADAIRIHANLQLAELLLGRIRGRIEVKPLSAHACEICLFLPAA